MGCLQSEQNQSQLKRVWQTTERLADSNQLKGFVGFATQQSHHPELAKAKLILFSFSGRGSLVARIVGYAPDRIFAAIEYVPRHREPIGIDTVSLPDEGLSIPQLIIANGR